MSRQAARKVPVLVLTAAREQETPVLGRLVHKARMLRVRMVATMTGLFR